MSKDNPTATMIPGRGRVPRGFVCTWCQTEHEFGPYVAAHARTLLTHQCDACGAKHSVLMYHVQRTRKGARDRKRDASV